MIIFKIIYICAAISCSVPSMVPAQWFESLDACNSAVAYNIARWNAESPNSKFACADNSKNIVTEWR
jgi:hypothetical protein